MRKQAPTGHHPEAAGVHCGAGPYSSRSSQTKCALPAPMRQAATPRAKIVTFDDSASSVLGDLARIQPWLLQESFLVLNSLNFSRWVQALGEPPEIGREVDKIFLADVQRPRAVVQVDCSASAHRDFPSSWLLHF